MSVLALMFGAVVGLALGLTWGGALYPCPDESSVKYQSLKHLLSQDFDTLKAVKAR